MAGRDAGRGARVRAAGRPRHVRRTAGAPVRRRSRDGRGRRFGSQWRGGAVAEDMAGRGRSRRSIRARNGIAGGEDMGPRDTPGGDGLEHSVGPRRASAWAVRRGRSGRADAWGCGTAGRSGARGCPFHHWVVQRPGGQPRLQALHPRQLPRGAGAADRHAARLHPVAGRFRRRHADERSWPRRSPAWWSIRARRRRPTRRNAGTGSAPATSSATRASPR